MPEAIIHFIDGASGIYIPQRFAKEIDRSKVKGIDLTDLDLLAKGPPNSCFGDDDASEDYWEIWADVVDNAEVNDGEVVYRLHEDDSLYLVCDDLMSPHEFEEFYGEAPDSDWWESFAERHDCPLYTLPAHWASYLINGDSSELEFLGGEEEVEEVDRFIARENLGFCVDVSSEPWFSPSNDANNLGGNVAYFLFESTNRRKRA